jgi:hypothetical protein
LRLLREQKEEEEMDMKKRVLGLTLSLVLVLSLFTVIPASPALAAGTTEVTVTKLASDGTTVLDQVTVTLAEMMADTPELPVYGDGETHYIFQGPIFLGEWQAAHPDETWNDTPICEGDTIPGTDVTFTNAPGCVPYDRWNPTEDTNCGSGSVAKDLGAVKGTAVNDLCNLVGGLSPGDTVKILAIDGFDKDFPAEAFYDPSPALGPGVLCWYTKDCEESFQGTGYVPEFSVGMRLAFLSDTSTNPWGSHIYGIKDMVENFSSQYWHFYYDSGQFYPSCGGHQVKWVSDIVIYTAGVCGDVDGQAGVSMNDGRQIFMSLIYGADDYPIDPLTADCDGNPGITMNDGRQIFMHLIYGGDDYPLQCSW